MFNEKFVQFGFIQGDGGLGRLKSNEHKGLEINIGRDDGDILPLFGLSKEDVPDRKYYLVGYNDELRELGFSDETLPYRKLPRTFFDWDDTKQLSFLRGLFSANGSALNGYGRISFKGTCNDLIYELKEALLKFDIVSNITTNKAKNIKFSNGNYLCKESYDLNIGRKDSVLLFMDKIGFAQEYKNKKIRDYFDNAKSNKTSAPNVYTTASGKYETIFKINNEEIRKIFDDFDEAVKFRFIKESSKSDLRWSNLLSKESNTFLLDYINPQDGLTTRIEVDLQGNIIQFKKL